MILASLLLTIVALSAVAVRDFLFREIEVFYFMGVALAVFSFCIQQTDVSTIVFNLFVNIVQMLFLIMGLLVYYRMKEGISVSSFFETKLGVGDWLFWIVIAPLFAPVNFICWMVISLLLCLVFYSCFLLINKKTGRNESIPLAGIQAVILVIILLLDQFVFPHRLFAEPVFLPTLY